VRLVAGSAQGTGVGVGKGGEMFRKRGDPKTDHACHLSFVLFLFYLFFFGIFFSYQILPSFLQADTTLPITQSIECFHHTAALLMELRLV